LYDEYKLLARLEAKIALSMLFDFAPRLRRRDANAPLAWRAGGVVRGLKTLPVMLAKVAAH
jgi:cytochrome P450